VYERGAPRSYSGAERFARAIGKQPNLVSYYSGWYEPFSAEFAAAAARHGATPLIQLEPYKVSVAAIAAGRYDGYLNAYAAAVRAYGHRVVLSFGHEMNGHWYPWSYQHVSPAVFVAAWRHVFDLFRARGARNATWLWTVNAITPRYPRIRPPRAWWPGSSYVNWVGIDGYYYYPSGQFAALFGPTIAQVRQFTRDPILIAETGATSVAGKPAKIANLFAGVRAYRLLGFLWFNAAARHRDFRLNSPAAIAAFRRGAEAYAGPAPSPAAQHPA
jgi:hypothetical protein